MVFVYLFLLCLLVKQFLMYLIDGLVYGQQNLMMNKDHLLICNDTKFVCERSQRLAKELINKLNV